MVKLTKDECSERALKLGTEVADEAESDKESEKNVLGPGLTCTYPDCWSSNTVNQKTANTEKNVIKVL